MPINENITTATLKQLTKLAKQALIGTELNFKPNTKILTKLLHYPGFLSSEWVFLTNSSTENFDTQTVLYSFQFSLRK